MAQQAPASIDPGKVRNAVTETEIGECFRAPTVDLGALGARTTLERHRAAHERLTGVFRAGMGRILELVQSRSGAWCPREWDPEGFRTGVFLPEPQAPAQEPVPPPAEPQADPPKRRPLLPVWTGAAGALLVGPVIAVPIAERLAKLNWERNNEIAEGETLRLSVDSCFQDPTCNTWRTRQMLRESMPLAYEYFWIITVVIAVLLVFVGWRMRKNIDARVDAVEADNARKAEQDRARAEALRRNEAAGLAHQENLRRWRAANASCGGEWDRAVREAFGLPVRGDWAGAWASREERHAYAEHRPGDLVLNPRLPATVRSALEPIRADLARQLPGD